MTTSRHATMHSTKPGAWVHSCAGHTGEPVWLLTTTAGQWVAECGMPGCGWTCSDLVADLVDDLAAGHATTHHTDGFHPARRTGVDGGAA